MDNTDVFRIIDSIISQTSSLSGRLISGIGGLELQIKEEKKRKTRHKEFIKKRENLLNGFNNTTKSLEKTREDLETLKRRLELLNLYDAEALQKRSEDFKKG